MAFNKKGHTRLGAVFLLFHRTCWSVCVARQTISNVLARIGPATDGHDDVLFPIMHVGYRGTALWGWHIHGADLLPCSFVIRAKHCASCARWCCEEPSLASNG